MGRTIAVKAKQDICFEGGTVLARAGASGVAVTGCVPSRLRHYGLVPVRWEGRRRAFWAAPSLLAAEADLGACITPAPARRLVFDIPRGGGKFFFGRNLRLFRQARGLSQSELARQMGKAGARCASQSRISSWENRGHCPSGRFLAAAAVVLDVPPFAFFVDLECASVGTCLAYVDVLRRKICGSKELQ